jgi:hypothetical protein
MSVFTEAELRYLAGAATPRPEVPSPVPARPRDRRTPEAGKARISTCQIDLAGQPRRDAGKAGGGAAASRKGTVMRVRMKKKN